MKKRFLSFSSILLLFLIFTCLQVKGLIVLQAPLPVTLTDSLLGVLKSTPADTSRVDILNTVSRQYLNTGDYEMAMKHAVQARELAEKLNYKMGLGNSYSNIGVILWYQGESEQALENHQKAIEYRSACGDIQGVGNSYNNIGLVYLNLSNYEKSLENYLKALKIREEIGDKSGTANSYNNIGVIYQKQNNYDKAIENYEKALKIREAIDDKFGIGMSYNNIGLIYIEKKRTCYAGRDWGQERYGRLIPECGHTLLRAGKI
jgi:tetratricopeptide (TPR) repeat protein